MLVQTAPSSTPQIPYRLRVIRRKSASQANLQNCLQSPLQSSPTSALRCSLKNSDLRDRCMDRPMAFLTTDTTIQIRDRHAILQASRLTSPSFKDSNPFVSLEPRLSMIRVQAGIGLGNSQSYHTCQRRVSATTSVPAHSNCACT